MNHNPILDSLGRVSDDLLAPVAALRTVKKRPSALHRWMAAAACLCLLVSTALGAEAASGSVSNLLAPLFGMAKTEIVDSIGVPVGVSATADGYTMTVDAIIGDRFNYAVVYTLTRDDGQSIPQGLLTFGDWSVTTRGSGAGSLTASRPGEQANQVRFVSQWESTSAMIGRYISVSFGDLTAQGTQEIIAAGPWELAFTLCYTDSTVNVPTGNILFQDAFGHEYRAKKLYLSPVGMKLELMQYETDQVGEQLLNNLTVSLELRDGTVVTIRDHSKGRNFSDGDDAANAWYQAFFETPIPVEDIAAVIICGTAIPVEP